MKQGIHQRLRVSFGMDLDEVEKIEFRFRQRTPTGSEVTRNAVWPSDEAVRAEGSNAVDVDWDPEETARFLARVPVQLDTRITLKGSGCSPETAIVQFSIKESFFGAGDTA